MPRSCGRARWRRTAAAWAWSRAIRPSPCPEAPSSSRWTRRRTCPRSSRRRTSPRRSSSSGTSVGAEPGTTETVLSLDRVTKLFGTTRAVDEVSLSVRRGEVFTLRAARGAAPAPPPPRGRGPGAPGGGGTPAGGSRGPLGAAPPLPRAEPPQPRHGFPVVRGVAAHDGVRERRLSAPPPRGAAPGPPRQGRTHPRPGRPRRAHRAAGHAPPRRARAAPPPPPPPRLPAPPPPPPPAPPPPPP